MTRADPAGTPCAWPGCGGALEADGFCDTCGRAAPRGGTAPGASGATGPGPGGPGTTGPGTAGPATAGPGRAGPGRAGPGRAGPATAPSGPGDGGGATASPIPAASGPAGWSGPLTTGPLGSRPVRSGGDDEIPPVPRVDPRSALLHDPQVAEHERFCRHGGAPHPVGRSRGGRPGATRGFCPQDGTPYSFAPPLAAGTLVAGQYEVQGALAHGGLGWIYLAVDRNVDDRWVVLKGVLNADDPAALAAARAERQFLAQLSHPGIVAIHNFVRHTDTAVDGVEADYIVMAYVGGATLSEVWRTPASDPAQRVVHALTSMIKILPALGHLHAEGHVYSDLKPDNVMQCEQRLTLIDMGAVARIDDADAVVYGTAGYHAPEVVRGELSPASDIYTVGRTLAVLALDLEPVGASGATPLPAGHPMLLQHESLHRLLVRATHPDPRCRFGSAEEMAEQLEGVRREVLATKDGRPRPAASAEFTPPADAFAPGLLAGSGGPGRPAPAAVAALLPQPVVEPGDPLAAVLAAAAEGRPVGPGGDGDWRHGWAHATAALAAGRLDEARSRFDALYTTFPGELAPPLALGATAECAGDDDAARRYYTHVVTVDPSWAGAAFGLARVRLRAGARPAAVAALHAVPSGSRAYVAAQLAAVEATLAGRADGGTDGVADEAELRTAAGRVERLALDPITTLRMRVAVFEAALTHAPGGRDDGRAGGPLLGCAWARRPLRFALEKALRELARLTPDPAERVALVDRANDAHPRTLR